MRWRRFIVVSTAEDDFLAHRLVSELNLRRGEEYVSQSSDQHVQWPELGRTRSWRSLLEFFVRGGKIILLWSEVAARSASMSDFVAQAWRISRDQDRSTFIVCVVGPTSSDVARLRDSLSAIVGEDVSQHNRLFDLRSDTPGFALEGIRRLEDVLEEFAPPATTPMVAPMPSAATHSAPAGYLSDFGLIGLVALGVGLLALMVIAGQRWGGIGVAAVSAFATRAAPPLVVTGTLLCVIALAATTTRIVLQVLAMRRVVRQLLSERPLTR